jgi:hypothetical protein
MSVEFNPLEERERHIIEPGAEILGGILLTRAAIVVDVEENPEPYNAVLGVIDDRVAGLKGLGSEVTAHDFLKVVDRTVVRFVPFYQAGYGKILKNEAELRGAERITQEHEIGLSRFISLAGICHQHSLLSGTMLRLLQERGDIGGTISIEPAKSLRFPEAPLDHPDRHTKVIFSEGEQSYSLDINTGVSKLRKSLEDAA